MPQEKGALGSGTSRSNQFGRSNYGFTGSDIHANDEVRQASDVLTIIRGKDGKPQVWSTGEPQMAKQLFREAAQVLEVKDLQTA